jgi:ribosomal protein S27AE
MDGEGAKTRPRERSVGVTQMICPKCGAEMNHHADKIDYASEDESVDTVFGGVLKEIHTCPKCGHIETRVPSD